MHGNDHAFLSTLHASDSFAKPFKIFVQIWLCEKLNLLEDVDWNWVYTPQRISTRDLRHPDLPEHMWRETMADIGIHGIVWRGYGLDIEYSAVQTAGFYRMVIPGMKSFTFYIPMRTLRQLGVNQEVPADDSVIFELPGFNVRTLQRFQLAWEDRHLYHRTLNYYTTMMDPLYESWLRMDVRRRHRTY